MLFVRNAEVAWPAAGHEHRRRRQPLQLIGPAACTAAGAIETGAADHQATEAVFITPRAKLSGAVYCNRSCLWVCLCVGLLPRYLENACIDLYQTGSVGEGSDYLQLIKFWPFCPLGKGVCGGAKTFGSALLQPTRNVCSLSAFFIVRASTPDLSTRAKVARRPPLPSRPLASCLKLYILS